VTQPSEISARRRLGWPAAIVAVPLLYVLSSGPVLATAFWLRETTGRDAFYNVMWLYYPLIAFRDNWAGELIDRYVTWWVNLFGTVGPG
jgi:hypothetical protein